MGRESGMARRVREWVPRWWRGEGGAAGAALSTALLPAEMLFRAGAAARGVAYDHAVARVERGPIPVVSVGNLAVGGAGKTPVAAFLAERLAGWGRKPAIVLRGYGADEIEVHRELNPEIPVFAAAKRVEAVRRAAAEGCDVAVVDDGFQHRALHRDLDMVLLSADGWAGRVRLLPRGPWREGMGALARADLIVITRKTAGAEAVAALEGEILRREGADRIIRLRLAPTGLRRVGDPLQTRPLSDLEGEAVLAVTTLADPRPFREQLEGAGAMVELREYPDHFPFDRGEAEALLVAAAGRPLLMTRKEAVKLRELLPETSEAWMVEQRVEVEAGEERLNAALQRAVAR